MRIGIDIQTLETFERSRGIGRLCLLTIRSLLIHAPEHEYFLFGTLPTAPDEVKPLLGPNATYCQIRLESPKENYLSRGCSSNFLWATPEARSLDVYHVTSPFMTDIVIPLTAPCPVTATLLDAIPAIMHEQRHPSLSPAFWKLYSQRVRVAREWQSYAAISQATADDCIRYLELPEERVIVSYVPVIQRPLSGWTENRIREVLDRYGLALHGYILTVTGFHPRKNFEALFGAYGRLPRLLRKKYPLVVVCHLTEDERQQLTEMARRFACADTVIFHGFVPDEDFPAIQGSAAVAFFPSRYEGFGLPVAEAMTAGVPVVTSNTSSLPEVAGEAGILHSPDDHSGFARALEEILTSPERRKELVARGFAQVSKFAPEKYVARLLEAYERARVRRVTFVTAKGPVEAQGRIQVDVEAPQQLRIAVFSPLSPKMSGIADFAEQIILNFSSRISPTCFIEDYVPAHPALRERVACFSHWEFFRLHEQQPFDLVLYELGNNKLHAYMLPYLTQVAGIVDLHDFSILGLFQLLARDYGFEEESIAWYARESGDTKSSRPTAVSLEKLEPLRIPMTRQILRANKAVIIHSQWLKEHIENLRSCPHRIEHIPLGVDLGMVTLPRPPRDELRRKYHLSRTGFVVACVGVANRLKRLPEVLKAFREFNLAYPDSYLVFVGPADRLVYRELTQLAASYGMKSRIRFFGHRPLPEFYEVLDLADIVVNLRYPTMGESSATLVAALAMGKPVLVTPLGQYLEFPEDVCLRVPAGRQERRILRDLFCELCENQEFRFKIAENARKFVADWSFHKIAARYEELFFSVAKNEQAIASTNSPKE